MLLRDFKCDFREILRNKVTTIAKRQREIREGFHAVFFLRGVRGLLASASVAAHELIDTTGGIDELALTGVEGV